MSIDELCHVMLPPVQPLNTGNVEQWSEVEEQVGFTLPQDYKAYVQAYGSGTIGGFLHPFNPFSGRPSSNLLQAAAQMLQGWRDTRNVLGDDDYYKPLQLYPEPGGLFPWGRDEIGGSYCWRQTGDADSWNVVVVAPYGDWWEYDETMTSLILSWLLRRKKFEVIPESYPRDPNRLFQSSSQ